MTQALVRLPDLVDRLRVRAAVALAFALVQSAVLLPIPYLVRRLFDRDVPHNRPLAILAEGLAIAACYIVGAIGSVAARSYAARVTKEAMSECRRKLVEKLSRLPLEWHDARPAGSVHAVVIQDCERVDRMVSSLMSVGLPAALTAGALAVAAALLNPLLFGVMALAVPLMTLAARRFARTFHDHLDRWHATASAFSAHAGVLLGGIATIRAAGAETTEVERFTGEIDRFVEAGYASAVAGSRYGAWQGAIATITGVAVLVAGGALVAAHRMSLGSLIAFYAVVALILRQISAALNAAPTVLEGARAIDRVRELLDVEEPPNEQGARSLPLAGRLELRGVTFRYGSRVALRAVDVLIQPGERVAVIGPNGAGKSTLLALLLGLYHPECGSVLVDGVPLADLDLVPLRRQFGVALQNAVLFPVSLAENITLGASSTSAAEIAAAVELAVAADFIRALPDGLETVLSDGGSGLSGGQRQRIALARALLRRPAVLLLDEPTANLDHALSVRLVENLRGLPWRPTTIVVTHDPAVAAQMDRVIELAHGSLVERLTPRTRPLDVLGTPSRV